MDETKFPYQLTDFIDKVNARYDGDPEGDYVMAEHMNDVQEAILRIEEALGIRSDDTLTVEERLKVLSNYRPLSVPQVGYFDYLEYAEKTQMNEMFNQYELIILSNIQNMPTDRDKNIYGYIDTDLGDLSEVQNNISSWKKAGADGIYLNNLNKSTREAEIELVRSVTQEGLNLIVSGNVNDLLNDQQTPHNSNKLSIPFPEETIFLIEGFGYSGELLNTSSITGTLLPLVRLIKDSGHQVMGSSDVRNRKDYKSVHTLALLLSLDYMYWGIPTGAIESQPPYNYSWTTMLGDWRTNSPNLFREGNTLYRYIKNGRIELHGNGEISFPGLSASSDVIQWVTDTVDGAAIKRGSIPADRIKTYNIEKIVQLINESPDNIRIDLTKVRSDDQDPNLPLSIPAAHLIDNVIEAINKKNNINSSETRLIEDYAIKSLEASKLTGHIEKEQLAKNTILAINDSSKAFEDISKLFINVPYADITNIRGAGQAEFGSFSGDTLTVRSAQVTDTFSSVDINASGIITSPKAEISTLQVDTLDVTEITGLTNLHVDNITADNMGSLVLGAIEANISLGTFDSIVTQSLKSEVVVSDIISTVTSFSDLSIGNQAKIKDLIANVLMADYGFFKDLTAGNINTDNISISSGNAVMQIIGDSIKVYGEADEENRRNLRVLIGNLEDLNLAADDYGIVALSEDGETRIFDHTGVYEGGIHKDSITTETLKDRAVTGRKIKYESITVDHLIGGTITGEWIDGEAITGAHIAGQTIVADHIDSLSIQTRHLNGDIIEGTHIKGGVIDGSHIKAGAISAEHLRIGYNVNLIKEGMDSFEQYSVGAVHLSDLNINVDTKIQNEYAYEGNKALRVMSFTNNATLHIGKRIPIDSGNHYGVSAYIRTPQGSPNVELYIGAYLADGNLGEFVLSDKTVVESTYRRKELIINDTKNYPYLIPVIRFESSNDTVLIDAVQIEEVPEDGEISPWRTTSTTFLSGDNITTGTIDAKHIHIGQGTIFGGGDVIDISDTGITARSTNGSASLNSSGLEVIGGAFDISSGVLGDKSFRIADGKLTAESLFNLIEIDPDKGFRIIDKENEQILFDTDPNTGEIRMSGTFRVYSKNNPEMTYDPNDPNSAWTIEDKINEIEEEIENIELTPGPDGKTAYEVAKEEGFVGTQEEWINSLVGKTGPGGKTAYELALDNGFSGSQEEWLNSLVGADGEDSYSSSLSNDNHTINTDSDGEKGFYEGAESTLTIYKGNKNDTHNWIVDVEEGPGILGEFDKESKTYKLTNISVDASRVIFKASKEGQEDIIKIFTVNRLKAATKGQDAITYLLNLDTFYLRRDREKETITPSEFSVVGTKTVGGRTPEVENGYFVVYEQLEDSITIDNYTDMVYKSLVELEKEYIISGVDFPYVKRYQSLAPESEIRLTPSTNILKLHIEWYEDEDLTILRDVEQIPVVSDGQDTYRVEIKSLNGDTFKNGIIDTWLYATVYKGSRDVTSEIEERRFEWTRMSIDEAGDKLWNDRYYGGRKEIKITHEDVYKRATFTCSIRKQ